MDLTLEHLDPAVRETSAPRTSPGVRRENAGGRPPTPIRLLPRDREEIARREARERRRRLLLNAAVGLVLVLLTALGIRYETRPGSDLSPGRTMGSVPPAEAAR